MDRATNYWSLNFLKSEDPMKSVLILAIALLVAVPACKRSDSDRARASSEERTSDTQGLKQQRDDYVKAMEAKLDEFDKKVSGLEQRASAMKGAAKDDFEKSIDRLREQRKAVARKLDDIKRVNVESWTTMKNDGDKAMADLEQSYEQVSARYEPAATGAPRTQPERR